MKPEAGWQRGGGHMGTGFRSCRAPRYPDGVLLNQKEESDRKREAVGWGGGREGSGRHDHLGK